jgi:hypothetical protein
MHLFHNGIHIGDYERSSVAHEDRKRREIQRSADYLIDTYRQYGKIVVRWNHPKKEIRRYREGSSDPGRGAQPLSMLPGRYWA